MFNKVHRHKLSNPTFRNLDVSVTRLRGEVCLLIWTTVTELVSQGSSTAMSNYNTSISVPCSKEENVLHLPTIPCMTCNPFSPVYIYVLLFLPGQKIYLIHFVRISLPPSSTPLLDLCTTLTPKFWICIGTDIRRKSQGTERQSENTNLYNLNNCSDKCLVTK